MRYRKGFTLIELLAVIVILAILLAIAIPRVTQYITNSRKTSFITTAKDFIDGIRKDATSEMYDLPVASNDVTIISISKIGLEKGGKKSSYNGRWLNSTSYVAIVNVGTELDPTYNYYIALSDSKKYTIPLTIDDKLNNDVIIQTSNSKNLITPLCGSSDGKYMLVNNIIGLEKFRSTNGFNATIYSEGGC